MKKILLASSNPGKIQEIQTILTNYNIIPQDFEGPEETGLSFVENAIIKARYACEKSNLPALADDSGLVVPALLGRPGIYSSRYAGKQASAKNNIDKLLQELSDFSDEKRHAYFYSVIVMMQTATDPTPIICEGIWHGHILQESRGEKGFGYDPIFYILSEQCSAAELSLKRKNQLSHRAQALACLMKRLI